MQIFLLTALTMTAFAANSVLNRAAVDLAGMDPMMFALFRVGAGAAMLSLLVLLRGKGMTLSARRIDGAIWLALYMIGFSLAYQSLDAGLGALILFGGVQGTMFLGAMVSGQTISARRWIGMSVAFSGLCWLLWPGAGTQVDPLGAGLMIAAAIGWGLYSLRGRAEADALGASAGNFALCLPMVGVAAVVAGGGAMPFWGVFLSVVSGAVTSGLGYALWYRVLPQLPATAASVSQLSAPIIAILGGALLLGESVSWALAVAGFLVLSGIVIAVTDR